MNIEKSLKRWTEAGLLSQEQSDKIQKFEEQQPSASWVLFGLSGLGIFVVLIGLISIIAANWQDLSEFAKLAGYFLGLLALAYAAFKREKTPGVVRESILSCFALYVLAGIGLIGQIYHLESDGYQALFFWLAIILPVSLITKSRLINNIWFVIFAIAVSMWIASGSFGSSHAIVNLSRFYFAISLPYIFLAIGYLLPKVLSENYCEAARFWSYFALFFPFAVVGNIAWANGVDDFFKENIGYHPEYILLAATLAVLSVIFRRIQTGKFLTYAICFTIIASFALIFIPITFEVGEHEVIGAALYILVWAGAAAISAALQRKRLFDLAALIIAVRFIIIYFEVFGSLAATGFGLILSGAVILSIAYIWHSYRRRIIKIIQESV